MSYEDNLELEEQYRKKELDEKYFISVDEACSEMFDDEHHQHLIWCIGSILVSRK